MTFKLFSWTQLWVSSNCCGAHTVRSSTTDTKCAFLVEWRDKSKREHWIKHVGPVAHLSERSSSSSLAESHWSIQCEALVSSDAVMFVDVCFSSLPQVGNAIKSSLHGAALKSNNKEGARSIQVEITPTSSRISRNAVTSLSIRGHRWKRHGKTPRGGCGEQIVGTQMWDITCTFSKNFLKKFYSHIFMRLWKIQFFW